MNIKIENRDGRDVVIYADYPNSPRPASPDESALWARIIELETARDALSLPPRPSVTKSEPLTTTGPHTFPAHICRHGVAEKQCEVCFPRAATEKEECPNCFDDKTITMSDGSKRPCELCTADETAGPQLEDFAAYIASAPPCGVVVDDAELNTAGETSGGYPRCSLHGRYGGSDRCPKCAESEPGIYK